MSRKERRRASPRIDRGFDPSASNSLSLSLSRPHTPQRGYSYFSTTVRRELTKTRPSLWRDKRQRQRGAETETQRGREAERHGLLSAAIQLTAPTPRVWLSQQDQSPIEKSDLVGGCGKSHGSHECAWSHGWDPFRRFIKIDAACADEFAHRRRELDLCA